MFSLPALFSLMVAGMYIHVVSLWHFAAGLETNVFVGLSLALKLCMQHLARRHLLKKNVTSLHQMFIIISVPTVLIDTQVRIVILRLPGAHSSLANSALMAIIEIIVRLVKVVWIRVLVRRKLQTAEANAAVAATASASVTGRSFLGVADVANNSRVHPHGPRIEFLSWQKKIVSLHTAETYADMYAEYIALICSAAITLFWSDNPQYLISADETHGYRGLQVTLLLQLAIEMAVDYCVSVVEIKNGIKLESVKGFGAFLGILFLMLTVVNINMSAVLYIRDRGG